MSIGVAILGSTGSIGTTALRVLARHRSRFHVAALTANSNARVLAEQAKATGAGFVGLVSNGNDIPDAWCLGPDALVRRRNCLTRTSCSMQWSGRQASTPRWPRFVRASAWRWPTRRRWSSRANSRPSTARESGGEIIPVDSEHSAILQCLAGRPASQVRRVILTASGGPFRDWSQQQIAHATLADALRHPTWQMGRKITVDSATLANKALEVIEAHFLFQLPYDAIDVVVHPQSVVHSMVEFVDGSVLAQVGVPSMELPVLYALTHPERIEEPAIPSFDPVASSPLTFERVRLDDFPALRLGIEAGRAGGAAPAVFNAANEKAVALFLDGALSFVDIARAISSALDRLGGLPGRTREELLAADSAARLHVERLFKNGTPDS
jgi:1-deoxy-D-xylulose-5-phosphate reductoisomerase